MKLILILIGVLLFSNSNAQVTFTDENFMPLQDTIGVIGKRGKSLLGYSYLYLQGDTIRINLNVCENIEKVRVLVARGKRFISTFDYDTSFNLMPVIDPFYNNNILKEVSLEECEDKDTIGNYIPLKIYPLDISLDDTIIFLFKLNSDKNKIYTKEFFLRDISKP